MPLTNRVTTEPITTKVEGDEAGVWAVVIWNDEVQKIKEEVSLFSSSKITLYLAFGCQTEVDLVKIMKAIRLLQGLKFFKSLAHQLIERR